MRQANLVSPVQTPAGPKRRDDAGQANGEQARDIRAMPVRSQLAR